MNEKKETNMEIIFEKRKINKSNTGLDFEL